MRNFQEARDRMFRTVIGVSDANTGIIEKLPDYPANLGILKNIVTEIEVAAGEQKIDTKGVTKYKLNMRILLMIMAADNSRKLASYAKLTKNTVLLGQVDYTESDFKRFTDDSLKDYARIIYNCAEPIVGQLEKYEITADTQAAFLTLINNYSEALVSPDLVGTIRKQATRKLVILFTAGTNCVADLTAAVEIVRLREPIFYLGFKTALKIIIRGKIKLTAKGQAKDANGEPVPGVALTITIGETVAMIKKTGKKGRFYIRSLAAGTYQFIFKKVGYADQTVVVNVIDGEMSNVNVTMVSA